MKTIERELFDWDGWDGEPECMTFYNPVLKVDIGKWSAGSQFDYAIIQQTDNGAILQFSNMDIYSPEATEFYYPNKVMGEYRLHYRVGETLSESP
jgi:hypothetical protein